MAPAPAAQQINGSTQLEQRIIRGLDAIDTRNRVEDSSFLLLLVIMGLCSENDGAELNQRPLGWPVNRGVVDDVALIGDLYLDIKPDGTRGDAFRELVKEVVGTLGLRGSVVKMFDAGLRQNAIASVTGDRILVASLRWLRENIANFGGDPDKS